MSKNNNHLIKKSKEAIHYLVNPELDIPANAIKGLNALQFQLQDEIRASNLTIAEYHERLGDAPLKLRIPMSRFLALMSLKTGNYEYLRDFLGSMEDIKVKWDSVDGKGSFDIGFVNLFAAARINNRCVEFQLTKEARILLASEENVAVIDFIKVAEKLKSRYSMHMNDLIEEHMQGRKGNQTFTIDDDTLRVALKIPYTIKDKVRIYSYKYPSELKQKVLDRVIVEYNEADMGFKINSVEAIKSQFDKTVMWSFDISSKAILLRNQVASEFSGEILEISHKLKKYGVSEASRVAILNGLVNEFEVAYAQYCIDKVAEALQREVKTNPGGYLVKAMKNNRESFESVWEVRLRERQLAKKAEAARRQKKIEDQIMEHRNNFISKKVDEVVSQITLGSLDYEIYRLDFQNFLKTFCISAIQRKWYKSVVNGDIEVSEIVKSHFFRGFLSSNLEIDEVEINEYIRSRSLTIEAG
jgi:3-methyladenine DNA glycosylase AlkC